MKTKTIAEAVNITYNMINSYLYKVGARMDPKYFSRERKMSFPETVMMILGGTKKSLQVSINAFLKEARTNFDEYSKQAFSQKRQYIKPEALQELYKAITQGFYNMGEFKTFRGYRISAIDGVCYNLPNTDQLMSIYGGDKHNNMIPQVQAQGSCLLDVLNGVIIDALLSPYLTNERKLAEAHINQIEKMEGIKELILMDRGYPSRELIGLLNKKDMKFLIRCPKNGFIKEIRNLKNEDEIITYRYEKEEVELRVLTITLENGNNETLITNVFDKSFTIFDFKYLYRLRWSIETKYNDIKNKLQIESFSGITPVAVLQDFYATMYLSNMAAFTLIDSEASRKETEPDPELMHQYKTNISMAISMLKINLIDLLVESSKRKQKKKLNKIVGKLLRYTVPIRNDRCCPRKRKHYALKFHNNLKNL